jgi:hypothetical protein
VLADLGHRAEDVPHRALAVDHVGDPSGHHAKRRRHPVTLADLPALVAEQRERQLMLAGEGGVPFHGIGADPDHVSARTGEDLIAVAKGTCLGRAAFGVVPGVEVQHDHLLTEPVGQADLLAGLRRQSEVRGLVANLNSACHFLAASLCWRRHV